MRHVNLRQTCAVALPDGLGRTAAQTPNGTQLSIEGSFDYRENGILEIVGHDGNLLSLGSGRNITEAR